MDSMIEVQRLAEIFRLEGVYRLETERKHDDG